MWWFLALAGAAVVIWAARSSREILYPTRRVLSPPDPLPAYCVDVLRATDGSSFDVWRLEAAGAPRGRLLLFHGYFANRYQLLGLADGLRQRGYEVLLFELRGHGSRPGPCTLGLKEAEDAMAVLRWAADRAEMRRLRVCMETRPRSDTSDTSPTPPSCMARRTAASTSPASTD